MASTISAGVGRSGSPMPRLITSAPAARLAAILRSSSANAYGGIRCRRSLGFIATARNPRAGTASAAEGSSSCRGRQLLHEHIAEPALVDGPGPPRQRHLETLVHLDLELSPIEHDPDARTSRHAAAALASRHHVGHGGAACTCARRERLPHSALEYARADARLWRRAQLGVPGDVGAIRESRMP